MTRLGARRIREHEALLKLETLFDRAVPPVAIMPELRARPPCFLGPLRCEWNATGTRLKLLEHLIYLSVPAADGPDPFLVPAGFDSDLASVPRIVPGLVRLLFRGPLETAKAAVLHDYVYREQYMSRRQADALFYEALRATGESTAGAWSMWLGVRAGGWLSWRRNRASA